MRLITEAQARAQTHSDGVDEAMLEIYAGAAEENAQSFLNRRVFVDESEMSSAVSALPAYLASADDAYDAAVEAASDLEGSARCAAEDAACRAREAARTFARETYDGIVVNDAIRAGVLLWLAHLYRNREDVVTGQGAAAVQIPIGAHYFLWPYRVGIGV